MGGQHISFSPKYSASVLAMEAAAVNAIYLAPYPAPLFRTPASRDIQCVYVRGHPSLFVAG